jgi:hypothetical protein
MIAQATELLNKAEKSLRTADHLVYITYPLIKENRLLKSVLDQLYTITEAIIKAALYYEHACKRIQTPPSMTGLSGGEVETFKKCALAFMITSPEVQRIDELLELVSKHQASSTEFVRKDRLVFMLNGSRTESISLEQLKGYLNSLKVVLQKTKNRINAPIQGSGQPAFIGSGDRYK